MTQNSMAQHANQAYRSAAITVPPLRGIVMLLDGASSYLQKSVQAQEARRFEEGYQHLMRATAILRGLSHHLDCKRGGALAERLFETYNALIVASLRCYGRPQMHENVRRIVAGITSLRDAWMVVESKSKGSSRGAAGSNVQR